MSESSGGFSARLERAKHSMPRGHGLHTAQGAVEKAGRRSSMEVNGKPTMLSQPTEPERKSEIMTIDGCSDRLACTIAEVRPDGRGHIVEINVRVRGVCPGKRVAMAVRLYELNDGDEEFPRGQRIILLPAHHEQSDRDILARELRFVLPGALDLSGSRGRRRFRAHVFAHYVDFD